MDFKEVLFKFENKYSFLYELEVNGVPFYTCHIYFPYTFSLWFK